MARTSTKSASKQKIQAGPKGQMQRFQGVGTQKPGVSSVSMKGKGGKKK
jgi:hypothetical protein